ncbi:nuclear transport factor 2 family protein [Thermocatellispora tengchongensis]|uniref:nuclear transport factor 2 family protein n=1 Tax=Thermocatellispora tengchongensis TaxID=1073253 RepID=UPI0036326F9E
MDLREIADRLEIGDLLARYSYAIDSGEWDLLDTVFTPDATIDYTSAGGAKGTRAEMKAWLAKVLPAWPGRQHLIGAATVTFTPGGAEVTAPFTDALAPSREALAATAPGLIRGGGWYHHSLVRTPDGWRSRSWSRNRPGAR